MAGSANRRRRQSDGAHRAAESRSARKQQTNPARTTRIRFHKVSALPDSFLTPRRSPQNEGMTEAAPLYSVGLMPRPDHEAIIRFGGEAPRQRAHSNERFDDHVPARVTTTSDRNRPVRQEKFRLACRNSEFL